MSNLPFALPDIGKDEIAAVSACLESGWLTSGRKVQEFEAAFASSVGARHAIAVNSATTGALLVLDALGVGPGTEVIVPAYTFSGPAMMAHRLGAKVVLADCEPGGYQVSPEDVHRKITERTRVVMPTHFGGLACNMDALSDLPPHVALVDDAAHALPTLDWSTNSMVGEGRVSTATFFSFYATKCLTTGEGGMVTTNDGDLAARLRKLRLHGFDRQAFDRYTNLRTGWKYDVVAPGWKANMTDVAAALGLVQLDRLHEMHASRIRIAERYQAALADVPGITLPSEDYGHAWHLYPVQVAQRDLFVSLMGEKGVQCSVHFIPLSLHSYWCRVLPAADRDCPQAEAIYRLSLSLPIYSRMTDADAEQVVAAVRETLRETDGAAGLE